MTRMGLGSLAALLAGLETPGPDACWHKWCRYADRQWRQIQECVADPWACRDQVGCGSKTPSESRDIHAYESTLEIGLEPFGSPNSNSHLIRSTGLAQMACEVCQELPFTR